MKIYRGYIAAIAFGGVFIITLTSGGILDLRHLLRYAEEPIPAYVTHTNIPTHNPITNRGATLGRVLFYDKNMSFNNTSSCAKCHKQAEDFGDVEIISTGALGPPKRHTMRIGFAGMSSEVRAFWNERAVSLEEQATIPIHDGNEHGFSGMFGLPTFDSLLRKMEGIDYYPILFNFVYGDSAITEERMQLAIAQFVRSIYAFDTKYDTGRLTVNSELDDFPNFTAEENLGKRLFNTLPKDGGAGCFQCHVPPEFGMDPNSLNNGNIGIIHGPEKTDTGVTKAPSLRNLITPTGKELGPFMHDGKFKRLSQVLDHYISLDKKAPTPNMDPRLIGPENNIELDDTQKQAIIAFLKTLVSNRVFTDEKWASPFVNDSLEVIPLMNGVANVRNQHYALDITPNPAGDYISLGLEKTYYQLRIFNSNGAIVLQKTISGGDRIEVHALPDGYYFIQADQLGGQKHYSGKIIKL